MIDIDLKQMEDLILPWAQIESTCPKAFEAFCRFYFKQTVPDWIEPEADEAVQTLLCEHPLYVDGFLNYFFTNCAVNVGIEPHMKGLYMNYQKNFFEGKSYSDYNSARKDVYLEAFGKVENFMYYALIQQLQ